jgi:hypothetical protein
MDKLIGRGRTVIVGDRRAIGAALALAITIAAGGCGSSNNNGGAGGLAAGAGGGGGTGPGGIGAGGQGVGGNVPLGTTVNYPFMGNADGFALDTFTNPGPYTDGNPQNLGGALDAGVLPVVGFDSAVGMPMAGSLTITAQFTDFNQTVNVRRVNLTAVPPQTISLSGKILSAEVRLDPGSASTATVHLFALSTPSPPRAAPGYYFAQGNTILLSDNNWHTLTFDLSVPEFAAVGFDATDIVQIGVQLASGAHATAQAGDGSSSSTYGAPQSIALHFDSVTTN